MDPKLSDTCGNCIERHLICDGTQPVCNTCIRDGKLCRGYDSSEYRPDSSPTYDSLSPRSKEYVQDPLSRVASLIISTPVWRPRAPDFSLLRDAQHSLKRTPQDQFGIASTHSIIPRSIPPDPHAVSSALPFVHYQYTRLMQLTAFNSPPPAVLDSMLSRISISSTTFSLMTLGARIIQSILDTVDGTDYALSYQTPMNKLHWQACNTPDEGSSLICMQGRLTTAVELTGYKFSMYNNASGYAFLKMTAPLLTRVLCHYPRIWTQQGKISIPKLLSLGSLELSMFVWTDTISSTLFGTTPLLHYNIDTFVKQKTRSRHPIEWLNGCPQEFIIWFAKLNSARSSIKQHGNHSPHIDWEVVEKEIREWEAIVDNTDLSKNTVTRLAVLEAWRQALLIYLYVGACGVTSADPRVQSCVKQIIRLSQVVKDQDKYERHIFGPAIIAGTSARLESQRQAIVQTIALSRCIRMWVLKASEFLFVLQHLWRGTARGGRPITWDDYVHSRKAVLHIDG